MTAFAVRPARPGEIPALLAFWSVAGENDARPADSTRALEFLLEHDPESILVVTDAGVIVGSVVAGWDGWRAHLYRLAVHPDRRRQGIASLLLDAAEDRLRRLGAVRFDAMVLTGNDLGASAWRARGYTPQAEWRRWVPPAGPAAEPIDAAPNEAGPMEAQPVLPDPVPPLPAPTDVMFIGGRAGVGKTTVASEVSRLLALRDIAHALIEGDNLDQAYPEPWKNGLDLTEQNLAALWRNYRAAGYSRLVYTNTVSVLDVEGLSRALGPKARAVGVLLTADDQTAERRLAHREIGSGLREEIARSRVSAVTLDDGVGPDIHRVRTDGRGVADIAAELVSLTRWV